MNMRKRGNTSNGNSAMAAVKQWKFDNRNKVVSKSDGHDMSAKSAKRKIDFNDKQVDVLGDKMKGKQVNNNSNLNDSSGHVDIGNSRMNLRSKLADRPINMTSKVGNFENSRVQWTKEFMDKVKKSNEKARVRRKDKCINHLDAGIDNNVDLSLQMETEPVRKGDGIQVQPDEEYEEELDYEDDLSVDDDMGECVLLESMPVETEVDVTPRPGTSLGEQHIISSTKDQSLIQQLANADEQNEEKLMNNPVIQKMMMKFFKENFKGGEGKSMNEINGNSKVQQPNKMKVSEKARNAPLKGVKTVTSPSDITVYAPALRKKLTSPPEQSNRNRERNSDLMEMMGGLQPPPHIEQWQSAKLRGQIANNVTLPQYGHEGGEMFQAELVNNNSQVERLNVDESCINQVANFVEAVRIEQHPEDMTTKEGHTLTRRPTGAGPSKLVTDDDLQQARICADNAVLEAEKFRTQVEQPGNDNMNAIFNIGSGVSDDDFFHLTCHIEPNLIHKIEKGEFIELKKLLPKDKLGKGNDDNRLKWVQGDDGTFLVPVKRDGRINSFRRWEQAFRAYATIYCGANPHRAKEIWQYITVINVAASSYIWDNVYNYDITFRHLMAFNPNRSWAVTYNQMWNLSMRDPIPRNNQRFGGATSHYSGGGYVAKSNTVGGMQAAKRNKSDYCWDFNKGVPCKFGAKCKFVERCKYCDSPAHGVHVCPKLQKKDKGNGQQNN